MDYSRPWRASYPAGSRTFSARRTPSCPMDSLTSPPRRVSAPPKRPWAATVFWQNFEAHRKFDALTPAEAAFIAERDSFYMATVSETGWPYVQHRGGPRGFLKVVDEKTLAFADY